MLIAVDANIILSALLGGKPSIILFDSRFHFITTEFTIQEVEKYLPRFSKKINMPINEIKAALSLLPIQIYKKIIYSNHLPSAHEMIDHVDKKDVDILALALRFKCYLWSQDKDFDKAGYYKLLKTYHFL